MSSRALPDATAAELAALQRAHGGRIVTPLHITCDRFGASETTSLFLDGLATAARELRPAAVRATSLMRLDRPSSRPVLKYVVEDTPQLASIRDAVHEASQAASLVSGYGSEVAWTVSALEDVAGGVAPHDIAHRVLFTADRFLVSRILADGFETLGEIDLGSR